ncbi:MAG: hypothetical protein MJA29_06235, partial [Candidatus Omnitrophica bacterium]|nr:hypothetical protein [Candidatus Omnitrophota bacterium]
DDDDSGAIHYLSLRYGGKVKDVADELNGMSLGGVGRATDIDHVEVMNNVDDGIEIFGGTVNLKYVNIWNVGDDAFDVDQGWRGKAQFGLIVQGYSADASQGSGVSDNCFETDGAEESDAQPVTTAAIYHFTAIGQPDPNGGDRATAWRDGARVQYRNCIFMDIGERLVNNDFSDGTPDGHAGYGHNGTLSFDATWTTPYTHSHDLNSTVNGCDEITGGCSQGGIKNLPTELYQAQTSGNLSEIRDSVFYNLTGGLGHAPVDLMSGFDNVNATGLPIRNLVRGPLVTPGGKNIYPVTMLDPRANSPEANTSVATAPADGFFTQANFRGAFSPHYNWLEGWTAVDAYNMTDTTDNPPEPSATINMTATTFFQTTAGISYTVEESDDMLTWTPVATIVGDGTIKSVTDLDEFDNAKFYRVIVT